MNRSKRRRTESALAVVTLTAIAFLIPGACGRSSLLEGWPNQPADEPNNHDDAGSDTGHVGVPILKLLAGGLGGQGNLDGIGSAARFYNPIGVASDGAGNLFVADSGNCTIRKVVLATGAVTALAGVPGTAGSDDGTGTKARFKVPAGLVNDGAGSLLLADYRDNTIRKVVMATGSVTTLAGSAGIAGNSDGTGANARFDHPFGVASDGAGNLFVSDVNNQTIRRVVIATGAVTTLAGSPGNRGSSDGTGADARFDEPLGVASDGAGNLFITDAGNNTLRKLVIATGTVTTTAGSAGNQGSTDGTGADARFYYPQGVASDGAGNLFVTDTSNHTLRKVDIATGAVTTLAGSAFSMGSIDGTGAGARFLSPQDVASDGAGNLFVTDSSQHTLRQVVVATAAVTTLAGATSHPGRADGTGAAARFMDPDGIAGDGDGNLFVADAHSGTIRSVAIATGAVTTLAGSPGNFGSSDGTGAAARFAGPRGLASDSDGNLFVADSASHTLRKITMATGAVTTLAGSAGNAGSSDGMGADARFYGPQGVASDGAGNVFVADSYNRTLRKVVIATGAVTTLAGSAGNAGSGDGIGIDARFSFPHSLASDGAGSLFVTDYGNRTLRKVVIATGAVTTVAGSPGISGSSDGMGTAARFRNPAAVAYDGAGNLFIADDGNSTLRKVVVATGVVTTVAGSPGHAGVCLGALPAGLNSPRGLAFGPQKDLYITDEDAVLVAQF